MHIGTNASIYDMWQNEVGKSNFKNNVDPSATEAHNFSVYFVLEK
jgi:hypothetical protein